MFDNQLHYFKSFFITMKLMPYLPSKDWVAGVVHVYPPFTRKRIVSLSFGGGDVRTRLEVAISMEHYGLGFKALCCIDRWPVTKLFLLKKIFQQITTYLSSFSFYYFYFYTSGLNRKSPHLISSNFYLSRCYEFGCLLNLNVVC